MSEFSPLAAQFLMEWNRMSMNMRSAIFRAKYLQEKAERSGAQTRLEEMRRERNIDALYREIRRDMRTVLSGDGVEKSFPADRPMDEQGLPGRFVDFRISEAAIPEILVKIEELDEKILTLFISLCSIRL